ncbi:NusG domain II-containing protein [bacterium]|nr:NusG domain II-containing protein [bacterium]
MKLKKKTIANIIFVLVILAAALSIWLLTGNAGAGAGRTAVLSYGDDGAQMRIPLDRDKHYDIDTGTYTIHLVVEDGGIRFVDSPCPDHTCESFGVLSQEGDWAACLPARASVTVE